MKLLKTSAILALAGLGVATQSAHAQAPAWTGGDVMVGFSFKNSSGSNDLLLDIGAIGKYLPGGSNYNPGVPVNIVNVASDMTAANGTGFGSTWFTSTNDRWGVVAAISSSDTLYAGHAETTAGTVNLSPGGSWVPALSTQQGSAAGNYNALGLNFGTNDLANASSSSDASVEAASQSSGNSWAQQTGVVSGSGVAFGYWGAGFLGTIKTAGAGDFLDFFAEVPTDLGGSSTPTYLGTFQVASNGQVTYTAAVPEPSTLAALAGGVGILAFFRRRRAAMA